MENNVNNFTLENSKIEVAETGRELLEKGLVARTWGNVSARIDDTHFYITPSGLDYVSMQKDDIVEYDMVSAQWNGKHKPSGERGVHQAAYQNFKEVGFVIHTHQNYATAIGLAGFEELKISDEEKEKLGGIATAEYGLPGSKKLTDAVDSAFKSGAQVILMIHHGVLVCGKDKKQAMDRVILLEEICKRNIMGQPKEEVGDDIIDKTEKALISLKNRYKHVKFVITPEVVTLANKNKTIVAQMDDMAQMIGRTIACVDVKKIESALIKKNAVLVKGLGAVVRADDEDDLAAMEMLVEKTAIGKLHTEALGVKAKLSMYDCYLMHDNYVKNYSKQKNSK